MDAVEHHINQIDEKQFLVGLQGWLLFYYVVMEWLIHLFPLKSLKDV